MAYTRRNYKTKKALREAIARGFRRRAMPREQPGANLSSGSAGRTAKE